MNMKSTMLNLWQGRKSTIFAMALLCASSFIMQATHIGLLHLVMDPPIGHDGSDPKN